MSPPRTRRRTTVAATASLLLSLFTSTARAQAPLEPADGQVYLGAWVDSTKSQLSGNDTPSAFNTRIGRSAFTHQIVQTIPVTSWSDVTGQSGYANETMIELTGTSAAVFMSVYPVSLYSITPDDYDALGRQILGWQSPPANRSVFLRFAPEMQGTWMPYGAQPTAFKAEWIKMYTAIKAIAPDTAIVWAPNAAQGYPYGLTYANVTNLADQLALDTAPNGQLDANDDAYAPYYPGDQYVDWCGISWYWKGTTYPYVDNIVTPTGYTDGAMTGRAPAGALGTAVTKWTPFYQTYCAAKNKPCMFPEMGAAYHLNNTGVGASQLDIQQAWWQETMTNTTFLDAYPKLKLFMLYEKIELADLRDLRDFRITNDTTVLNSFLNDLSSVESRYIWATNQSVPDSAIQSAAGFTQAIPTYKGTLSLGMPVQTKGPSVFSNSASAVGARQGGWMATGVAVGLALVGMGLGARL